MNGFPTTNRRAKVRSRESEFPPTKRDYPILTISAVVLFSRSLERSYPRSASSRKRVASASFLSEPHLLGGGGGGSVPPLIRT